MKVGHFHRFAHSKVMIQKRNGRPTRVLTGSANFSVRGLYVQANNVLVVDDPEVAAVYEQGTPRVLTKASSVCSAAGAGILALFGRRRRAAAITGGSLLLVRQGLCSWAQ